MEKKRIQLLIIGIILTLNVRGQDIVIQGAHILPMNESSEVVKNMDIWLQDGKIQSIVPTGTEPVPDSVKTIVATGHYVLPGLSEMHAHIPVPGDGEDDTYVRETLMLYMANGVTVIRGMLGNPYHLKLKQQVESGEILGPRIYTSSPSMNGNSVPDANTAEQKVRSAAQAGYDFLKIHPGIKLDVMQRLVRTAMQEGIRYAGHVPADVGIRRALQYKYWSVDHADGYIQGLVREDYEYEEENAGFFGSQLAGELDWTKMDELASLTVENEVWIVPTQTLFTRWFSPDPVDQLMASGEMSYMPASTRYAWTSSKTQMTNNPLYSVENYQTFLSARQRILRELYEAGAGFLLGSDSPQVMNVPGFSIHHEIEALMDAGLPIDGILLSGTSNPARFFGDSGTYGRIVEGLSADLMIVSGNPLEDHRVLRNPVWVCVKGHCMDRDFFTEKLAEIEERHKE